MLRNRNRRDIGTLPYRIRNNFRRQSQGTTAPSNNSDEIMLHDGNDDEIGFDEMLEQRSNHDDYVDMNQSPSVSEEANEEEYDDYEVNEEYDDDDDVNEEDYDGDEVNEEEYDDDDEVNEEEYDDDEVNEEEYDDYATSESEGDHTRSEGEEGNDADPSSGEKTIIAIALDEDNLPHYNGNFAPYFQDFTTAALFCWIHKHNISTNAYEDLVDIIMNQEFDKNHIVKNIRRFKTWRQHLPLLPISAKSVSISSKKTPSTSKDSKIAYQLSINDIIWHVLSNPSLVSNMYFGPGIDSETKSEYWHGTL